MGIPACDLNNINVNCEISESLPESRYAIRNLYIHIWLTAPVTDLQGNTIWHKIMIRNIMMKPINFIECNLLNSTCQDFPNLIIFIKIFIAIILYHKVNTL